MITLSPLQCWESGSGPKILDPNQNRTGNILLKLPNNFKRLAKNKSSCTGTSFQDFFCKLFLTISCFKLVVESASYPDVIRIWQNYFESGRTWIQKSVDFQCRYPHPRAPSLLFPLPDGPFNQLQFYLILIHKVCSQCNSLIPSKYAAGSFQTNAGNVLLRENTNMQFSSYKERKIIQ